MAEEEISAAAAAAESASPLAADHKRKHEDVETDAPENPNPDSDVNLDLNADPRAVDTKRPRIVDDENSNALATENGSQVVKEEAPVENHEETTTEVIAEQPATEEIAEQPATEETDGKQTTDLTEKTMEVVPEQQTAEKVGDAAEVVNGEAMATDQPSATVAVVFDANNQLADPPSAEIPSDHGDETVTRKMEVPNNKVGVLIGKAGDTIRLLQLNSGAKIQIMSDLEADPDSTTRPVELVGSLESINKAEKLIRDVMAEASAGGSPSLVARGFGSAQPAGASEQIEIQVPNEKVGFIIGKGGETIKNLQTRSGARIQVLIPHPSGGGQPKERTVKVTGDKKQVEMARELIKEVMTQIWLLSMTWGQVRSALV